MPAVAVRLVLLLLPVVVFEAIRAAEPWYSGSDLSRSPYVLTMARLRFDVVVFSAPFVVLVFVTRRASTFFVGLGAATAAAGFVSYEISSSESSTAPLAVLWMPLVWIGVAWLGVGSELVLEHRRTRATQRASGVT